MRQKRKKRPVTLIEIMIVILLIGMIGGALAFNMRGSVDKGKVFKSEQNANRVYDILMMATATGDIKLEQCINLQLVMDILQHSPLVKDADKLIKDGWGDDLSFALTENGDLRVYSTNAEAWHHRHPRQ